MTRPTHNQSRAIADAATTPATILVILCVGALCLVAMDVAGLNVGICVAAIVHAIRLWLPLLAIVLAALIGGGLVVASMAARKWEQS